MTTTTATPARWCRPRRRDTHHRDRRSHQDLLGNGLPCRRRAQPAGRDGRGLRAARSERRRQDHDHRRPDHPCHPDGRSGVHRRHRRRAAPDAGQAADRRRVAAEHAGPPAQPRSRTSTGTGASSAWGRRNPARRQTICSSGSSSRASPRRRSTRSPAAWPSASWWPAPSSTGRRSSFSTSPPPDSTRRVASLCGICSKASMPRARPSCSPRTTWRRRTSSATGVAIMDHGKILALDTPAELKRSVGRGHHRHGEGRRGPRRSWPRSSRPDSKA